MRLVASRWTSEAALPRTRTRAKLTRSQTPPSGIGDERPGPRPWPFLCEDNPMKSKTKAAKKPPRFNYADRYQGGPSMIRAREFLRPYVEAGERVDFVTLAEKSGMSVDTFERAIYAEVAYQEGRQIGRSEASIETSILNEPYSKKFARLKARLEAQMATAVYHSTAQHIREYVMPLYAEKLKKADAVLSRSGSTVFTN